MWRGGNAFVLLVRNNPRVIGAVLLPVTIVLAICAWLAIHGPPIESQHRFIQLQDELSFVIWLLLAILSAWVIWPNTACFKPASALARFFSRSIERLQINPHRLSRNLGIVFVAGLVLFGLKMQLDQGRANLDPNASANKSADAGAGKWIRDHTDKDVVIMARHVPTVYHYSERKIVWFPPSSNPQLLMKGIAKHKVDFVIVAHREFSYYLPPDDTCFASLFATYPDAFRLVCERPGFRIFRVATNEPSSGQYSFGNVH
jgi:hypothetical protein